MQSRNLDELLGNLGPEARKAAENLIEIFRGMTPEELAKAIVRIQEVQDGERKFRAMFKGE